MTVFGGPVPAPPAQHCGFQRDAVRWGARRGQGGCGTHGNRGLRWGPEDHTRFSRKFGASQNLSSELHRQLSNSANFKLCRGWLVKYRENKEKLKDRIISHHPNISKWPLGLPTVNSSHLFFFLPTQNYTFLWLLCFKYSSSLNGIVNISSCH